MVSKATADATDALELVDITRHNFESCLPRLEEALGECDFVAFDCEMTGLFLETNGNSFVDDMTDRYKKMQQSACSFAINQFGISAFALCGKQYVAKTFNFNLFPRSFQGVDKRFTSQASSLEYLAEHNFDFNKMVYDGVPYLTLQQSERLIAELDRPAARAPCSPSAEDDVAFVENLRQAVGAWYTGTAEKTLLLGQGQRWNSFQVALCRTLLDEMAQKTTGWVGFYSEQLQDWSLGAVRLTRASQLEYEAHLKELRDQRLRLIQDATGFSSVMKLVRDARKPVVGHNMLFDVIFTLNMFVAEIPAWTSFKGYVKTWFPAGLYDTKYVCRVLNEKCPGLLQDTSLGPLYVQLQATDADAVHNALLLDAYGYSSGLPEVDHAPGYTRYAGSQGAQFAHEAGFDAYMTGTCFVKLLALAAAVKERAKRDANVDATASEPREGKSWNGPSSSGTEEPRFSLRPLHEAKGRINIMKTDMPYCTPYGADPQLTRDNVLVLVSNVSSLPSYKEVRNALKPLNTAALKLDCLVPMATFEAMAVTIPPNNPFVSDLTRQARQTLETSFEAAHVFSWEEFSAFKARGGAVQEKDADADARSPPPRGSVAVAAHLPNKRPRVESPARSFIPGTNCIIM